jgi:hypothetical protein
MLSEILKYFSQNDFEKFVEDTSRREVEDRLYAIISEEIQSQNFDRIAYMRAFEAAEGDHSKTEAYYIRFRMVRLRDEMLRESASAARETARKEEARVAAEREKEKTEVRRREDARRREVAKVAKEQLETAVAEGRLPDAAIMDAYKEEYQSFRKNWLRGDPARKFIGEQSCWAAFFSKHAMLD